MRMAVLFGIFVAAGMAIICILLFSMPPELPEERTYPPEPLFLISNRDNVSHQVHVVAVPVVNGTVDDTLLNSENFTLEGGSSAHSSVTTNRSGEYRFSVSVDGTPSQTSTGRIDPHTRISIHVMPGQEVETVGIHIDYQAR